ncbi:MAG: hypothetical protein A3J79_04285 [Elusimicrobia bacterium RIFOXYB2_FULL_62_6]|nr:MAG: hypothetical protein A3J79_04285 [Elusimicrobia bacterium RIFOXYB2_FULL_62_6]
MTLQKEELLRYSRQLAVPEVGAAGQEKLKAAKVAVVGAGGLGSAVLSYLAAAGVGELGAFDHGAVELSNLHRQLLYGFGDVGAVKTAAARRRLLELAPGAKVNAHEGLLTAENMTAALAPYPFIADCTDNFRARAAVNRACFELDRAYVHAAVCQFEGQLTVFEPRRGPCLECLVPNAAQAENLSGAETGIIGPAVGAVACLQALEVMKLVLGMETLKGRLALLDFRRMGLQIVEMSRAPGCPVCGRGPGR